MVSRSDELTPAPGHGSALDIFLKRRLTALLPKELQQEGEIPAHLAFGFQDDGKDPLSEQLAASMSTTPTSTDDRPVVILCRVDPPDDGLSDKESMKLASCLCRWHQDLPPGSFLMMAVPLAAASESDSPHGNLPSHQQPALRGVIRLLSEHGFAIRKELPIPAEDIDVSAPVAEEPVAEEPVAEEPADLRPAAGWQLISSRKDPFRIQSYAAGDERAILELFPTCFQVQRGRDHWRWKYLDNPFGDTAISLALSDHRELGAHYAGYAMPLYYNLDGTARTFPVMQMGDTMTNPVFRHAGRGRSGLLARTVRHFFSLHRGGSFGFFYGFNTGAIQRFCSWFIGGSKVEPVGYWRYDRAVAPSTWSAPGYRVEHLKQADGELNRLFRLAAPHYRFLVQRDARYVHWRYLSCPDTEYVVLAIRRWRRLVGWGVFRRREDRLVWGDAFIHPRHRRSAGALLATASTMLSDGAPSIETWFSRGPEWWTSLLPDLGFTRQAHPQRLGFMALPDGEPEATHHLPDLYYTMGDGDLF